jgi:hypothetical protein
MAGTGRSCTSTGPRANPSRESRPSPNRGRAVNCLRVAMGGSPAVSVGGFGPRPCHFRGVGGCTIYEERPADPCRGFVCGWLQRKPVPRVLPAGPAGVIIMKPWRQDRICAGASVAPDAALLEWMRNATGAPFLFDVEGRPRVMVRLSSRRKFDKATREPLLPGEIPVLAARANCRRWKSDISSGGCVISWRRSRSASRA